MGKRGGRQALAGVSTLTRLDTFRGSAHLDLMNDMQRDIGGWLRDGKIRYEETVVEGLEHVPDALARFMRGDTTGKTLVRI